MTSKELARAFLQTHLGQTVSMKMLEELSESFESHRADQRTGIEAPRDTPPLRAVPDVDQEVDDDSTE